jgi:hypothetical protein
VGRDIRKLFQLGVRPGEFSGLAIQRFLGAFALCDVFKDHHCAHFFVFSLIGVRMYRRKAAAVPAIKNDVIIQLALRLPLGFSPLAGRW